MIYNLYKVFSIRFSVLVIHTLQIEYIYLHVTTQEKKVIELKNDNIRRDANPQHSDWNPAGLFTNLAGTNCARRF